MDMKKPTEEDLKNFLLQKYLEESIITAEKTELEVKRKISERYRQRLMKVSAEDFFKYLAEKGVSRHCIACGSNKLSVPQSVELKSEGLPKNFDDLPEMEQELALDTASITYMQYVSFEDLDNPAGLRKSYYMMHCQNCGNLTLYRSSAVLNWLESKHKNEGGDNE
ncbi:hypothetical protein ACJWRY_02015 [Klebsiella pneumoniae]